MNNSNISCPHCAAHELRLLGKLPNSHWFAGKHLEKQLPGGALYLCCSCRLKFRYQPDDADVYQRLYDNTAVSTWPVDAIRRDWELVVGYILQRLPRGGRILDFDCYTGGLLSWLDPIYERHGVEINKAAAALATDKQLAQLWSSIDDIPSELRFDIVIASDVIEHISDPGRDKLLTQLTNDGALIITTAIRIITYGIASAPIGGTASTLNMPPFFREIGSNIFLMYVIYPSNTATGFVTAIFQPGIAFLRTH